MTATFDTYTPTAFDFPTLPDPCRWSGGWPDSVFTIEVIDGKITNFYAIRNPEKLASATVRREICR